MSMWLAKHTHLIPICLITQLAQQSLEDSQEYLAPAHNLESNMQAGIC